MKNNFHLGIVVQNNDPQKRGRLKIFIPHISLSLIEGWINTEKNKDFEKLSDSSISSVIDEIKLRLPWANCAAPIFGEIGGSYYDSYNKQTKEGDNVNKDGSKPAKPIEQSPPTDSFGNEYKHSSYDGSAKGLFSIPKVGSRVWVFFENGDLNKPIYFATQYSKGDWDKILNEEHYPDKLENYSNLDGSDPHDQYRNKMVISQRGGIIEIINSDNKESLQISHYNGGFKIWTNSGTQEYVEGDDKKLVKNNLQLHVKGNSNKHIEGNANKHIEGNSQTDIDGNANKYVKGNSQTDIDGNANKHIEGNSQTDIEGNSQIHIGGNMNVVIEGNANVLVNGTYTVESLGNMIFKAPRIDFNP